MLSFTFVTQSAEKVEEAQRILKMPVRRVSMDLPELQAVEVEQVIANKAQHAYGALGNMPVMVEDTGLFMAAWNGLPGALIKWFNIHVGGEGICHMLNDFPSRAAWAKTVVATYHDNELHVFVGRVDGSIASSPVGSAGFGWDAIFIPNGSDQTFAQMSGEEKDKYSMRRQALEAMHSFYS